MARNWKGNGLEMEEHISRQKKPAWEGYILHDFNLVLVWKRKNHGLVVSRN